MKRSRNLKTLVLAVILSLSLIVISAGSQVLPVQASQPWTKYGRVSLDGERYVADSWVIKDGTTYKMWYTHAKTDLTITTILDGITTLGLGNIIDDLGALDLATLLIDIGNLVADDLANFLSNTSTVIGYAESVDGTTWTVKKSEALTGASGIWSGVGNPSVIKDDSTYKMWYTNIKSGLTRAELQTLLTAVADQDTNAIVDLLKEFSTTIGYAESVDGKTWIVQDEEVLVDSGGLWRSVGSPSVIKDGAIYKMWYTRSEMDLTRTELDDILQDAPNFSISDLVGILDGTRGIISYAESADGMTWTVKEAEALKGTGDIWSSVDGPSVIKSDGTYEMWYMRGGSTFTSSELLNLLNELDALDLGTFIDSLTSGDLTELLSAIVSLDLSGIKSLLSTKPGGIIAYATSSDGKIWAVVEPEVITETGGSWNSVGNPSVIKDGTTYKMWYAQAVADLTVGDILPLLDGTIAAIAYAYYTPAVVEEDLPPSPPPPTPAELGEMTPEEAAEELEELSPEEAAEIIEELPPEEAAEIVEEMDPEVAAEIVEEMNPEAAADVMEEMTPEAAADVVEEMDSEAAADVVEEMVLPAAADVVEEMVVEAAADVMEEMVVEAAADVMEEMVVDAAADVMEEMVVAAAADVMEEMVVAAAADVVEAMEVESVADVLEEMEADSAADVMEEVSTSILIEIVPAMSEESLTERLPELTADKLHEIPPEVLFAALPNAPTEQLVDELPPEPPPDLPDPIVVYETPTGVRYMAIRTAAGEWVIIVGSPMPIDKLMIKVTEELANIETVVEEITDPIEAALLPSDVSVASFFEITLHNITSEQVVVGHIRFKVEHTWIEENNINKWSVFLNRYDEQAGRWVKMPTTKKDEDRDYVYYDAAVDAFSLFAITGSTLVPPLEFRVSNLSIAPAEAKIGETVTITANVKNELGITDKYVASLWVNSTIQDVRYVTLAAGETGPVSFTVTKDEAGSYQVRIGRQMGSFEVLPEVIEPTVFTVAQLSISPAEVEIGEEVTISARVTNTGEVEGSYEATLKVNGVVVATEEVTLAGGATTIVTFTVTRDVAATYQVEIDGQHDQFTVTAVPAVPPPPPPAFLMWGWIVIGVVGVAVIAFAVYFLVIRPRRV